MAKPTRVYIETGTRRVFACAFDWPGWCRSGKTEELALETLAAYAPRYAVVTDEAEVRFPKSAGDAFDVVERLRGDASTDFGVPGKVAADDRQPWTRAEAEKATAMLVASWAVFDRVVAGAPATLRKGPRGGGRDRDKIVEHVRDAEVAYGRQLGLAAAEVTRDSISATLRRARSADPVKPKGWPPRYAARRIVWHVLDHAWEIEDRRE